MPDFDVVVIGSGPAGLTAGAHLARDGHSTLVLERELWGGNLQHVARIDDYPAYPEGVTGAQLAAELIDAASSSGAKLEQAEVSGLELFSRSRWVACSDGRGFSCKVVILAGGTRYQSLGLPNEDRLRGRGVIDCTPCDGGFFVDKPVAVYGSNRYAMQDATYLAELGANVTLLAPETNVPNVAGVELRRGVQLIGILGEERVEGIVCADLATRAEERLVVRGVAIRTASVPNSEAIADVLECDSDGFVITDADFLTSAAFVLACGDIRGGGIRGVASAVEEGTRAAAHAAQLCTNSD
jgi:thioredoxin reductase (NADPH)